jgi:hypothetical protein
MEARPEVLGMNCVLVVDGGDGGDVGQQWQAEGFHSPDSLNIYKFGIHSLVRRVSTVPV